MSRFLYRLLTVGAVCASMTAGAAAQTNQIGHDHEHADGSSHILCGSIHFNDGKEREALAKTAQNKPEVYQRLLQRAKHNDFPTALSSGLEWTFIVRNRTTGMYDEINATLVYEGRLVRIWLDNADTARIKMSTIRALAKGLDSTTEIKSRDPEKSIIENVTEVFGTPPPNRFDLQNPQVQDFLLTDIKDGFSGAFVAGFFSPWDQSDAPGSNRMNLLYIDSKEGIAAGIRDVLSTLAHEFQHLVHYATNNNSQTVFNEGCSEVASILSGYQSRGIAGFLGNTNVPFFSWNHDDGNKVLNDYQRSLAIVYYLYEQYGEQFLTELARMKSDDMDRIGDALTAIGREPDWKSILTNFAVANYLKTYSQPYGYKVPLSPSTLAKLTATYSGTNYPATGSVTVQQYASAYYAYANPGGMKIKFDASQPFRVMALLYKGTGTVPVEIRQMEDEVQYSIGENTTYSKVIFVVANLAFNAQQVSWEIEQFTSGVEDDASGANALEVASITPNPATGPATVDFTTAASGPVSIQIYDLRGSVVRTLVDGDRYEAGMHQLPFSTEGLPSGYYVVRLTQGEKSATRVLSVTR